MVMWRTAEEVRAASAAMKRAMPGWRAPMAYGLGVVSADGAIDWRVVNSPNLHQLPAVVLATVLGYRSGSATYVIDAATLDAAIALLEPAGACDAFEHPNLWAWQRLRAEIAAGAVAAHAGIVVVFVGDAADAVTSHADRQFRTVARLDGSGRRVVDGVVVRRATPGDLAFLREMLYLALFVPPGAAPFPADVVDTPDLSRIVDGFGTVAGDAGWVAESDGGGLLGAAWVRRFTGDAPGFGYVDDVTPELAIAVRAAHRGRGFGTILLKELIDDVGRVCLSVDVRNAAMRLYARVGFVEVRRDGFSATMLHAG